LSQLILNNRHNTRGHPFKLVGTNCRVSVRQRYFSGRVINEMKDIENKASFKNVCLETILVLSL
jgi:hypothetical protein